jgi:hypothetical protein
MAHAHNNIITGKLQGSLGKQLVFRDWEGKTIVAKSPKARRGSPSTAQAQIREKFLLASRYARFITKSADQSLAQGYASAVRPRQNVYSRALEDFLSSPVVTLIDTAQYQGGVGDRIVIRAHDDFRVTKLTVTIYAANGAVLETGRAGQNNNGLDWTYTALQANSLLAGSKIKAVATDVPGNEAVLELTL